MEQKETARLIYVIVPLTVPGSSKNKIISYFEAFCKKAVWEFEMLSVKAIKLEIYSKLKERGVSMPLDNDEMNQQRRKEIRKKSSEYFYEQMAQKLESLAKSAKSGPAMLFLRKNHPPGSWYTLYNFIKKKREEGFLIELIAFLPKPFKRFETANETYPISLGGILDALIELLERENEEEGETLEGQPESERIQLVLKFVKLYANLENNRYYYKNFNGIIEIEISDEQEAEKRLEPNKKSIEPLVAEFLQECGEEKGVNLVPDGFLDKITLQIQEAVEKLKWKTVLRDEEKIVSEIANFFAKRKYPKKRYY